MNLSDERQIERGIVYSAFSLNLNNELNIYHQNEKFLETKTEASGGVPLQSVSKLHLAYLMLFIIVEFLLYLEIIVPSYPKFAEKN